ncbi:TRAP transporter small permease [Cardiobacterium valvarum]|uniref:TRAP transporter small permease protein n=1 Tax=Cardiobacterium valvarum TaxID=194702 RepID=A0A381E191_9GAMM|nr:TRAP transporter small permease subunit [Cardiobacterium valvarum]SUX19589.1 TRAP-type C4-dicarboxylate transport system, small permease component [Cardiobacterium valvarum]
MSRLIQLVSSVLRWATGLAFAVLMAAVLIQVVMRTFSSDGSPVWTEEVTRYALLYIGGFGAALSLWTGVMVNVDLLSEHLPGRLPWVMRLLAAVTVFIFAVMLIEPAWRFTKIGMIQTSPSMPFIKMAYIHASVFILLATLALTSGIRIIGMLCGKLDGHPELKEEEELP